MRSALARSVILGSVLVTAGCHGPVSPSSSAVLDQFVSALRQQGLSVTVGAQTPPQDNRFFSVPAQQVQVNEAQVSAFVYPNEQTAAAEAAAISSDGQPNPTVRITWVGTPRFYRQGQLIVLYVGCSEVVVRALATTVGAPIVTGSTPCVPGQ